MHTHTHIHIIYLDINFIYLYINIILYNYYVYLYICVDNNLLERGFAIVLFWPGFIFLRLFDKLKNWRENKLSMVKSFYSDMNHHHMYINYFFYSIKTIYFVMIMIKFTFLHFEYKMLYFSVLQANFIMIYMLIMINRALFIQKYFFNCFRRLF